MEPSLIDPSRVDELNALIERAENSHSDPELTTGTAEIKDITAEAYSLMMKCPEYVEELLADREARIQREDVLASSLKNILAMTEDDSSYDEIATEARAALAALED